jgi:hypothetical protein
LSILFLLGRALGALAGTASDIPPRDCTTWLGMWDSNSGIRAPAMYLRCRDKLPLVRPERATRDHSRLSCGVGDTQLGPRARIAADIVARALFIELHRGDGTQTHRKD